MSFCSKHFILLFMTLGLMPFVFSIKCWTCRSSYDHYCADPFNNSTMAITDCTMEMDFARLTGVWHSMCMKMIVKDKNKLVTVRGCTWKRQEDGDNNACRSFSNGFNEIISCETCEYDGCNDAAMFVKTTNHKV